MTAASTPLPSVVSVLLAAAYQQKGEAIHPSEPPFKLLSYCQEANAPYTESHVQHC